MAEIRVDTTKMRESGQDIMDLALELESEFNNLFERIAKMPTTTFEWTGAAANAFAKNAQAEKVQYMQLKDTLYNYGKYLNSCAELLEKDINVMRY